MIDSRQAQAPCKAPAAKLTTQTRSLPGPLQSLVMAIAVTTALAGCGGGGSEAGPVDVAANSADATAVEVTEVDEEGAETPDQQALAYDRFQAKQDLRWTDATPCTEEQMRGPFDNSGSVGSSPFVWNRHKLCARLEMQTLDIELTLRKPEGAANGPWTLAKGDVYEAGYDYQRFAFGKAEILWDIQLYGPPDKLQKTWANRVTVKSFQPSPSFPSSVISGPLKMQLRMNLGCTHDASETGWKCPGKANGVLFVLNDSPVTLELYSGYSAESPPKILDYSAPTSSGDSIGSLFYWPSSIDYSIAGCTSYGCSGYITDRYSRHLGFLRCDQDVLKKGSAGCVFPAASAVMTLSKSLYPEIHQHIQDAFAIGAPGRFVASAQNPAVTVDSPGRALHWDKDKTTQKLNRQAACNKSRNATTPSLLINRIVAGASGLETPYSTSCSSINQAGCQCDEFPFASSYEGASHSSAIASARMVNGTQNMTSGGDWGAFLIYQRVMPWQASFWDDAWIDLKDVVDRGASAASQ